MMKNVEEYWAEACQAWFDATVRTDVNSGINQRQILQAHDPDLSLLLEEVRVKTLSGSRQAHLLPINHPTIQNSLLLPY